MQNSGSTHAHPPASPCDLPPDGGSPAPHKSRRHWLRAGCAAVWNAFLPTETFAQVPALVLAQAWKPSDPPLDLSRYLVSEKLDGVRAYWDGQAMWFRSGASLTLPAGWQAQLPRVPLDGELWLGRGQFEALSGLLRRAAPPQEAPWRQVRYMVFESPHAQGGFAERYADLQRLFAGRPTSSVQLLDQTTLPDQVALDRWLEAVVVAGGEGLMLHRRDAPYVAGRSDALLKLKPFSDAEATVIAHLPGKGRHTGRLGALQVRTPEGQVFALGSGFTDAQRDNPPLVGSEVVYRYQGLTRHGVPRFATFWRERGPG